MQSCCDCGCRYASNLLTLHDEMEMVDINNVLTFPDEMPKLIILHINKESGRTFCTLHYQSNTSIDHIQRYDV